MRVIVGLAVALLMLGVDLSGQSIPVRALQFKKLLISNARAVWGLDAPVATMAAQVHQESGWRPNAKSPYAGGLAQFTPGTAADISRKYPELAGNAPYEPAWALRALARYDKDIYNVQTATTRCDQWAFTLSAYNGGPGWVIRDKRLAKANGADPEKWFGHVEYFTSRAAWAKKENRAYPLKILITHQPMYLLWGVGVDCTGVR
jgi:soluble lytic murein transglycosylase-like protein